MIKNNKGITLVELIVALAIFSIIISLTFSMLLSGNRTFNMQIDDVEDFSSVRNGMDYITREIRKADKVDVLLNNILKLNETDDYDGDIYKLHNNSITKNGSIVISNINEFNIKRDNSKIDIEIKGKENPPLSSTIYIRGKE